MSDFGQPPGGGQGGGGFGQPPSGGGGGGFGQPPAGGGGGGGFGQPPAGGGGGGFGQPPAGGGGGGGFGDQSSSGMGAGGGGFAPPPPGGAGGEKTETLAIVSAVCGGLGLISCCCICLVPLPIAAIVTGALGISKINKEPGLKGKELSYVGIGLGAFGLLVSLGLFIYQLATGGGVQPEYLDQF